MQISKTTATTASPLSGAPSRMLRLPEVMKRVGLSRSSLYAMAQAGTFPKQRRLTPKSVAWLEDEVETWISSREAA